MKLLCIGDVALGDNSLSQRRWPPPRGLAPGDESRVLFNWELPMGDSINPVPRSRGRRFLAFQDASQVIQKWSPGFATLATNHILDAGEKGLIDTIESLNQEGFIIVGAGQTTEEIAKPLFWETGEGRLAIVNWVFPETHPEWMAVPGPNCWPGPEKAKETLEQVRDKADWVMVVVHWSDELFSYPRPEDRATAWKLAQMGADLVIGHHPHVVRGMEIINSCPIFYSIGNFYFSDLSDHHGHRVERQAPRNREGLGIQISLERGKRPAYRVRSFWQTRGRAVLDPIRRAQRRMELASRPLRRFRGMEYTDWHAAERARFDKRGYLWHFGVWQISLRGLARFFSRRWKANLRISGRNGRIGKEC